MTPFAEKLDAIVVPEIELRNARLSDSLEFLKQEAHRLDEEETNPFRRGVPIVWLLTPGVAEETRVSAVFHDADLRTALQAIAEHTSLALVVNESGVFFVPPALLELVQSW